MFTTPRVEGMLVLGWGQHPVFLGLGERQGRGGTGWGEEWFPHGKVGSDSDFHCQILSPTSGQAVQYRPVQVTTGEIARIDTRNPIGVGRVFSKGVPGGCP